jgi:hypothetical protein
LAGVPARAPGGWTADERQPTIAADTSLTAAAIKKNALALGECESFENGVFVYFDAELHNYACIVTVEGSCTVYKRSYEVAVAFARSLPPKT